MRCGWFMGKWGAGHKFMTNNKKQIIVPLDIKYRHNNIFEFTFLNKVVRKCVCVHFFFILGTICSVLY